MPTAPKPNRDLLGLTLSAIQACCTSMSAELNIGDIDMSDYAELVRIYHELLVVQKKAAGITRSRVQAPAVLLAQLVLEMRPELEDIRGRKGEKALYFAEHVLAQGEI